LIYRDTNDILTLRLLTPLESKREAKQFYETLKKSSRHVIAHQLASAKKPETRQRRFTKFMDMLTLREKPGFGSKKTKKT
jgi:uncharacterized protein YdeI (YjbR/CyaY-like superfamily)